MGEKKIYNLLYINVNITERPCIANLHSRMESYTTVIVGMLSRPINCLVVWWRMRSSVLYRYYAFLEYPFLPELLPEYQTFSSYTNITEKSVRKLTSSGGWITLGQINLVKNLNLKHGKKGKENARSKWHEKIAREFCPWKKQIIYWLDRSQSQSFKSPGWQQSIHMTLSPVS